MNWGPHSWTNEAPRSALLAAHWSALTVQHMSVTCRFVLVMIDNRACSSHPAFLPQSPLRGTPEFRLPRCPPTGGSLSMPESARSPPKSGTCPSSSKNEPRNRTPTIEPAPLTARTSKTKHRTGELNLPRGLPRPHLHPHRIHRSRPQRQQPNSAIGTASFLPV